MPQSICDCHDRLQGVVAHYLGVTLFIAVLSSLYIGVSGRAKDNAVLPILQSMQTIATLIVGGMLAVWSPRSKDTDKPQDVEES